MKAPTDKRNDTIQIVVTRSCDLFQCSNCTQLLPFRKDTLHMSLDCFREACRSVKDWPGIVGLFGGNPCSHPRFPELCEIMVKEIPDQRHRGLWSNNLLRHGQVARDTFYPHGRFNLNAHADEKAAAEIERWLPGRLIKESASTPAWHSPILLDRRDLGVTDEDWVEARESCDVNVHWSSAIVEYRGEPYAYFCEVAAALDGVRGEMHGVPAVPGWWREKMPYFQHQVERCCDRGCGVPLRRRGHLDRDDTYDVSPSWVDQLEGAKGKVSVVIHQEMPEDTTHEATDYMERRKQRGAKDGTRDKGAGGMGRVRAGEGQGR